VQCHGRKTKPQSEILELVIPRGKQPGSRIPFYNKADEAADLEAGDIVVVLAPGQAQAQAHRHRSRPMGRSHAEATSLHQAGDATSMSGVCDTACKY